MKDTLNFQFAGALRLLILKDDSAEMKGLDTL